MELNLCFLEISKCFKKILMGIDYHLGHLPKDVLVNEEQVPELQPVFSLFVNKLSPETNCVTPKELALYTSLSSKNDQFLSLDKVLKGIEQFYDENTRYKKICSSDLEALENKILNSQQELKKLKAYKDTYEIEKHAINNEIISIQSGENRLKFSKFQIDENLKVVLKLFNDELDGFGVNFNKLHNVINSLKNDTVCSTKMASSQITNLMEMWRRQILCMIKMWFATNFLSTEEFDLSSSQIHKLSLVSQSVIEIKYHEMHERCEITKINMALADLSTIKNDFENCRDNSLYINTEALKRYIDGKFMKKKEIIFDPDLHMTTAEVDDLQLQTSNLIISDVSKKILDMETIENRISFIHDSMEHYVMICDVIWCLSRTGCSMANLKCELALHCCKVLQIMFDDIKRSEKWNINYTEDDNAPKPASTQTRVVKFDGYQCFSKAYENCDEMNQLRSIVQKWQSKYDFKEDHTEDFKLLIETLQKYAGALNCITGRTFPELDKL